MKREKERSKRTKEKKKLNFREYLGALLLWKQDRSEKPSSGKRR